LASHRIGDLAFLFTHSQQETTHVKATLCAAALAVVSLTAASAQDASGDKRKVTLVYDQVLPNVPGKSIRSVLVE
jgi:hypothetical protein